MLQRDLASCLVQRFEQYPLVTVTGPRHSGKTTLCRASFPELNYVDLEEPLVREQAEADPEGFLSNLGEGAILDEVQHAPALIPVLRDIAEEANRNGVFVLIGSAQFGLLDSIVQTLAGRTALLCLLPLSMAEQRQADADARVEELLCTGFFPQLYTDNLPAHEVLEHYFETYLNREVRSLAEVRNLSGFRKFIRTCAEQVGQPLNLSTLCAEVRISHPTARHWLLVLEASYLIFLLPPYQGEVGRRLVKSPRLYFYDVGLASYLLGIRDAGQLRDHPACERLFKNAGVLEALKYRFNRGYRSNLSYLCDARDLLACDLLYSRGLTQEAIALHWGDIVAPSWRKALRRVVKNVPDTASTVMVASGAGDDSDGEMISLAGLSRWLDQIESRELM